MSVFCPECDSEVALPDQLVDQGVAKIRCAACGSRFRVLPGGATMLLESDMDRALSDESVAPRSAEENPVDPPDPVSDFDDDDGNKDADSLDVHAALEDLLGSVEGMRRKVRQQLGVREALLDALSDALDEATDNPASDSDLDLADSDDPRIAMLLDCKGSGYELVQAAEKLEKLGATGEAMDMMARAEESCEDALDWLTCAEYWLDRENKTASSRCLEAAEDGAIDGEQSVRAAGLWARLGAGRDRQIKVLFVADDSGYCTADRAEALVELGEPELARELLHKAEQHCNDTLDWLRCANVWKQLEDTDSVRRCLEAAEQAEPDGDDMERMGELWDYLGEGDDRRLDLLAGEIRSAYDVAERVQSLLKLEAADRARDLIVRAEATCDDAFQWVCCAEAWDLLEDEGRTLACLQKAEAEGMDWEETERALKFWQKLGASHEQQIALLKKCTGSGYCASGAARLLHEMGESAAAREVMTQGEEGNDEGLDWLFCAEAWLDMGDRAACERCLTEALTYSLDGDETERAVDLREKLDGMK